MKQFVEEAIRLEDDLQNFVDSEEMFLFLIENNERIIPMNKAYLMDAYRIKECASATWFHCSYSKGTGLFLEGKSESKIIQGMIALLQSRFSGTVIDKNTSMEQLIAIFDQLFQAFSSIRQKSLSAIIQRLITCISDLYTVKAE